MQAARSRHDSIDISFERHPSENLRPHDPLAENTLNSARNTFEWDEEERVLLDGPSKYMIPEDGDPWEKCYQKVKEHDDELFRGWRDQVDKLLIFAGLLAATVTSFVIDSWKNLREDPADKTNWFLEQLLLEIHNANVGNVTVNSPLPTPQTFVPSTSDVRLNVFWFMSLSLSLATVLIGIICSQWLREYQRYTRLPPLDGISVRQLRYEGLFAWKVPNIVMSLPVLLQFSLVLFFVGLLDQLWNLNFLVAAFVTIIVGLALLFIIVTTLLPSFQLYFNNDLRSPLCPYKSPQAWVIHRWVTRFFRFTNTFKSSPRIERDIIFFNDKTWVNADHSWYMMKKRFDQTHVHNDTVRGLIWIDKHLENSLNMVFSIYHCIKSLLPEEGAQVVSQIDKGARGYMDLISGKHPTMTIVTRETNLALYLEAKSQIFPQLEQYHLDSFIRLLNTRIQNLPRQMNPSPFVSWPLYDITGMPEDLVARFLLCAKDLISLGKLSEETMSALWHLLEITTRNTKATHQQARYRKIACNIVLAMEERLPNLEDNPRGTPDPNQVKKDVKYWTSHAVDLFGGWAPHDPEPCCKLALETLDRRIMDSGGPSAILSPEKQLAWETIVLSASLSPITKNRSDSATTPLTGRYPA